MRLMFGLGNRQAFDVVATAGKQADDPGENTRLVADENRQRMIFDGSRFLLDEIGGAGGL
ncbi:hypothetical protein D3C86_1820860 [compost metagenome]